MRKSLIALVAVLLPFSAFAEDYRCEFLENENGVTGLAELKQQANGEYKLRLLVSADGETQDGTSDESAPATESEETFDIGMQYTYYDIAHGNKPPVAKDDVKSLKHALLKEGEMEVEYTIFRDAERKTLDQLIQLNGYPIACKR